MAYLIEYNLNESKIIHEIDTLFKDEDFPEQQMSEVIGNNIFIFGGVINGISQDIYKYNIVDHSYAKLDVKLLEPRAGGRAIIGSEPNQILIIGGYNETSQTLNSVEVFYDFGNEYYITQAAPIQQARYNFMTAKLDDYIYILGGFDENGKVINSIERTYSAAVTDLEESIIENNINLFQNYPNPFNPTTTIEYSVPSTSVMLNSFQHQKIPKQVRDDNQNVNLIVYDVLGREIETLVNKNKTPGNYQIQFDGTNLPSGVYYYQLRFGSNILTKKMLLLK
ncbi:MAG: hypothetical protein IPM32_02655 [Ignavibacteriae bacterium]|nr:hypothetical protein [Ignavibacteriota bacterium]